MTAELDAPAGVEAGASFPVRWTGPNNAGDTIRLAEPGSASDSRVAYAHLIGNPVSMAVGLAVLDVIEVEGLRERAAQTGEYLREGFRQLAGRYEQIGDVRGLGLFIGVELVLKENSLDFVEKIR